MLTIFGGRPFHQIVCFFSVFISLLFFFLLCGYVCSGPLNGMGADGAIDMFEQNRMVKVCRPAVYSISLTAETWEHAYYPGRPHRWYNMYENMKKN